MDEFGPIHTPPLWGGVLDSLSKKDFIMRIKICRKEARESAYWLRLIVDTNDAKYAKEAELLTAEAIELKKIFSSIVEKSEK